MPSLGSALRAARRSDRLGVLPYLMVDRRAAPGFAATVEACRTAGAVGVELGFPFSDPIADGPTLQGAAERSLAHGTRWVDLVTAARATAPLLPAAVMSYANPVLQRGLPRALRELRAAGVSALIVPDLPWDESGPWRGPAARAGIDLVLFAAPGTSAERVARAARTTRGFLYVVSRFGTTGREGSAPARDVPEIVRRAHESAPETPVLIGFGVTDARTARAAAQCGADGVIVGSAVEEARAGGRETADLRRLLAPIAAVSLPRRGARGS